MSTTKRRRARKPERRRSRVDVTRAEFVRSCGEQHEDRAELTRLRHDVDVQFLRTAQIQADLDAIKKAWDKMKMPT